MSPNNQSLAPRNGYAPATFSAFITSDGVKKRINEMMGGKDGQRFTTSIVSAVTNNPALAECDHMSIFSAAMLGESLGLSPSTQLGQFYMVPFNDRRNNRKVATFQIGYKGYIQLAIRSGQYKKLNVLAIKEGELIHYDPLFEELEVNLIQDDTEREQTPTIGYYAMFEYLNGFRKTMYWSKEKMEAHADKYSQAFKLDVYHRIQAGEIPQRDMWKREYSSFWYKDFDGMAYKTMLRQIISKWGVMSTEMQQAMAGDNAMLVNGEPQYIDTDPVPASRPTQQPQGEPQAEEPAESPQDEQQAAEDAFFGEGEGEGQPPQEEAPRQEQPEYTEDDWAAVLSDNEQAYIDAAVADKRSMIAKALRAFGVSDNDMTRKVGKSFSQWGPKDRIALLEAYRDLAAGGDPADIFPTA